MMKIFAVPLDFKVLEKSIGEHTWVASDDGFCESCSFGNPNPTNWYCKDCWKDGKYTPRNKDAHILASGKYSNDTATCMADKPTTFMKIPRQSDIVYGINGVCHQLANRTLWGSNITVAGAGVPGAKGYLVTYGFFGIYGTSVPYSLLPYLLRPVGYAVSQWAQSKLNERCKKCGLTQLIKMEDNEWNNYLKSIQELYTQPITSVNEEKMTAKEHLDILEKNFEIHMQEIDLTLNYYGRKVNPQKISELHNLWEDFHRPSPKNIEDFYKDKTVVNFKETPDVNMSQEDLIECVDKINIVANEVLKNIIDVLGPDDFKKVYGQSSDEPFQLIDPNIMTGQAIDDI